MGLDTLHRILAGERPKLADRPALLAIARGTMHDELRDDELVGGCTPQWLTRHGRWWDERTDTSDLAEERGSNLGEQPGEVLGAGARAWNLPGSGDSTGAGGLEDSDRQSNGRAGDVVAGSGAPRRGAPGRLGSGEGRTSLDVACCCSGFAEPMAALDPRVREQLRAALSDVAAARSILASLRGGPDAPPNAFCYAVGPLHVWSGRSDRWPALYPVRLRAVIVVPLALRDRSSSKLLATAWRNEARPELVLGCPARCGLCGGLLGTGRVVDLMLGSELAAHPVFGIGGR